MQFDQTGDTTKLCRVCMTAKEGHRTDLYDTTSLVSGQPSLHGMLKAVCVPVFEKSELDRPPGMPTKVCSICRNAILAAFKLHQTCIESNRRFGELLAVKRELQDLEHNDGTGDPLGSNSKETLRDGMLNTSDEVGCVDGETRLFKEEQPKEKKADSLSEAEHVGTIKVEELNLMEENDNDNDNASDCDENEEPLVEEDSSKTTCKICSKSFSKAAMLRKHMSMKHKKTIKNSVKCSCGRIFKSEKRFNEHTASGTCSGEIGRKCKLCNKIFKSVDVMVRHRNSVHSEPVVCSECGKTMANFNSLRMHLRVGYCSKQKDQPPTEAMLAARTCKVCGELQKTRFAISAHMKVAHPDRMFRCDICGKEFQLQRYLDLHKVSHGPKTYLCPTCNETLPTKEALKKHRRTHKAPITCNVCGKVVATNYSLSVHMERHVGLKPFACDNCPMRFFTKAEIRGHMLTHTKKQDHVCDLCGSRFTTNHSLKKHVIHVHEGQRPFPCSLCSLKFAHANQLQRHMYTHTGEKPHKCELCPQAYAQTNDLVKHVARAHGDGNPYLCDLCDEGFRLLTDLRQHYRVHVQSTEGGADQMEEVRFTSVAILKRAFAKAKQRLGIDSGLN
uniref:Zinc finger protein 235 n=1 Tax=Culex pipiens TaxID=7175 RepID=A0A8D8F0F3_CULPI